MKRPKRPFASALAVLLALAMTAAACSDTTTTDTEGDGGQPGDTTTSTEAPGDPLTEVRARLADILAEQVFDFELAEIDVAAVAAGLEDRLVALPLVDPENVVVQFEAPAARVQLRIDGLTEGVLRDGEGEERIPLSPEQNFRIGECVLARDQVPNCGALTIIDESQTMLTAAVFDQTLGTTYVEPVDLLLGNADDPEFPGLHVLYNNANTAEIGFPEDDELALGEGAVGVGQVGPGLLRYQASSVLEETRIVLDSDVTFYNAGKSTVWSRQEAIFNVVSLIYGLLEPLSTDASPDTATWGLTLQIKGQETWVSGGPTTTNKVDLTDELEDPGYFLITPVNDEELHHFFVGYNVSGVFGRASGIGTATAFGGAAGKNHAYSEARVGQTLKVRWVVMAHEQGHLIGGTHGNGVTSGCSTWFIFFQFCGASLMPAGSAGGPDTRQPYFSDANDGAIASVLQSVL